MKADRVLELSLVPASFHLSDPGEQAYNRDVYELLPNWGLFRLRDEVQIHLTQNRRERTPCTPVRATCDPPPEYRRVRSTFAPPLHTNGGLRAAKSNHARPVSCLLQLIR